MSVRTDRSLALARRWYAGPAPGPGWRALETLYKAAIAARRSWYRRGWKRCESLSVPVVVVGNLSVGGSGKTPLVIALVQALQVRGLHPGVVSRGYGGSSRGPELIGANSDPAQYGDEPCLIRQRCQVPVAIGRDRVAAARLLPPEGVDVIISDDGLQHYRLARDIEICVIDGKRRFGNGRMLPAGPLREPLTRLAEIDIRVCNGGRAEPGEVPMSLRGSLACTLHDRDHCVVLDAFARRTVHAVAGIGHPQQFFDSLRVRGIEVIEHAFADHHRFIAGELEFGDGLPILMTEKDAIKCRSLQPPQAWVVPVDAELPQFFFDDVVTRLARRVPQQS